jgi:hypothetical protein
MDKPRLNFAVVAELINLSKKHGSFTAGADRWDFLFGQKLMWFDTAHGAAHVCEVPSGRFTDDFRLRTICGAEVTTAKLCVIEDGEFSDPSCPKCFGKTLKEGQVPARRALRATSIGGALATLVIALNLGLFAEDAAQPLTAEPPELVKPSTFDDL